MGIPGGGALRRFEWRLRPGPCPPPAACLQGGLSGSASHLLRARACGRGGPALSLWPACPAGGCVPRGWWEAVPGGWPSFVVRGVCRQALSLSRPPVLGGGQPGPVAGVSRARVVWVWQSQHRLHSARPCEPALRTVGVGEGRRRGGALRRCEGRLRSGARPLMAAGPQGGLSGSATQVLWARACRRGGQALSLLLSCPRGGCVPRGWWEAVPGGWPSIVVRGVCCQALSLSRLPVSGGGRPGPVAHVSRARVVWVWNTQHRPHSARSCEPALRAVGVAGGCPGGGCLAPLGRLRSGARPFPAARPLGGLPGSATLLLSALVCERAGAAVSLWLECPAGGCVPRGWWWAVHLGLVFHRCEGRLSSGAAPLPDARPWERAAMTRGPCVPCTGGVGMGDPAPAPQHALLRARVARCGGGGRASPGGGALRRCEGRLSSGARPPPAARPQGGLSGSAIHVLWARLCGRGDPALSLLLECLAGGYLPRSGGRLSRGGGLPPL